MLAHREPAAVPATLSAAMLLKFDVDLSGVVKTASSEGESGVPASPYCLNATGHTVICIAPLRSANLRVDETKAGVRERLLYAICIPALHCGRIHGHSKYRFNYMRDLMRGF